MGLFVVNQHESFLCFFVILHVVLAEHYLASDGSVINDMFHFII